MSAGDRMQSLFLFSVIFNLIFAPLSFVFTNFGEEPGEEYQIAIDEIRLNRYGISFVNATSFNITFSGGPTEFEQNDKKIRVEWLDRFLFEDTITFSKQSIIERTLDTWFFPEIMTIFVGENAAILRGITNSSIVTYFDTDYNWTKIDIDQGVLGFLTTIPQDNNNITKAVYDTGILTLTIGEPRSESWDAGSFIDWYWSLLFGFNDYGLPSAFAWLMRLLFTLTIVSAVFVTRDLLPIP
jgi:hypothetical protein